MPPDQEIGRHVDEPGRRVVAIALHVAVVEPLRGREGAVPELPAAVERERLVHAGEHLAPFESHQVLEPVPRLAHRGELVRDGVLQHLHVSPADHVHDSIRPSQSIAPVER